MFLNIFVGVLAFLYNFAAAQDIPNGNSNVDFGTNDAKGQRDIRHRWPGYPGGGIIPYVIEPSLAYLESIILTAIETYNKTTCIRFVTWTEQKDYVDIVSGDCDAPAGRLGGRQTLVLGSGCEHLGNIMHELGHAIGLFDQHSRSDRDEYITINETNIQEGNEHYFVKFDPSEELLSTKYDYHSIMHQGNFYKSKSSGFLKTLEARTGEKLLELAEKTGITDTDIQMIQNLYECH